ncbi:Spindle assembly abnormal protein 6 like [Dissostichus eleginoides]|uniref:Spindle assembly abnormal protein 6 like n=1 Tax=Dissostichus eleginoides TaxID=100907 RepID=A0AAD9CJD0_DISEL|nr:Spindle assembly abnormal protein 6 like [Dissostichus eleginoides]
MQRSFLNRPSAIYGTAVGSQPSIRTEPLALRSQYPTHQPSLPLKLAQRNISNSRYIPGLVSSPKIGPTTGIASTNPPTTGNLPHSQPPAIHLGTLNAPLGGICVPKRSSKSGSGKSSNYNIS